MKTHKRGCELELCPYCKCCAELCECKELNAENAPDERRIPWDGALVELFADDEELDETDEGDKSAVAFGMNE